MARKYDAGMIRSFFEQLCWELRIRVFENEHPGAINEDLVNQLQEINRHYRNRKGESGLIPGTKLLFGELDTAKFQQTSGINREARTNADRDLLAALETLGPTIEGALKCVEDGWGIRELHAADFLNSEGP